MKNEMKIWKEDNIIMKKKKENWRWRNEESNEETMKKIWKWMKRREEMKRK